MLSTGHARRRMERTLNAAYGDGLLSQQTLIQRLDLLLGSELVDPARLVGDLTVRRPRRALTGTWERLRASLTAAVRLSHGGGEAAATLLALDWSGACDELLVGRHDACDVMVGHPSVSRRHARLSFRDGHWVLRDLDSTNGTRVNGKAVVRCRLEPGDRLSLGSADLLVD
ncbi:MAG TPA: FHA domain-containing protein [Solirubrobacteraceae bacterium]|nr:FHA domain-containing protein [Solirubrobacteraceae bacterium]